MTVQELIDELEKIEDRSILVSIRDYEGYDHSPKMRIESGVSYYYPTENMPVKINKSDKILVFSWYS